MTEDVGKSIGVTLTESDEIDLTQAEIGKIIGVAVRDKPYDQSVVSRWRNHIEPIETA